MAGRNDWPGDWLVLEAKVDRSSLSRASEQVPVRLDRAAGIRRSPALARFSRRSPLSPFAVRCGSNFKGKSKASSPTAPDSVASASVAASKHSAESGSGIVGLSF
ncbi:hypothetical protein M0R45_018317 [Rubus argutus]|uniref:Uncharacterized protein n=1 Tax=Rubus argutus TaxID=59490 RepID=A0AAW1X286_RUBAR